MKEHILASFNMIKKHCVWYFKWTNKRCDINYASNIMNNGEGVVRVRYNILALFSDGGFAKMSIYKPNLILIESNHILDTDLTEAYARPKDDEYYLIDEVFGIEKNDRIEVKNYNQQYSSITYSKDGNGRKTWSQSVGEKNAFGILLHKADGTIIWLAKFDHSDDAATSNLAVDLRKQISDLNLFEETENEIQNDGFSL